MTWEYHIELFDEFDQHEVLAVLKTLGEAGWELVHVSQALRTYFFKRPTKTTYRSERVVA